MSPKIWHVTTGSKQERMKSDFAASKNWNLSTKRINPVRKVSAFRFGVKDRYSQKNLNVIKNPSISLGIDRKSEYDLSYKRDK